MALGLTRRLFTVEEYYRMVEAGVFSEDDRVELLEGEIYEMAAIGSRHAAVVDRLNQIFSPAGGKQYIVRVQSPVRLSRLSEPQPDLAILRHRPDFYAGAHPTSADVLLIVEVADTTAETDRSVKVPLCARSGIPEVWLIDLAGERVEVYRSPSPHGYLTQTRVAGDQMVSPLALPDVVIPVEQILG